MAVGLVVGVVLVGVGVGVAVEVPLSQDWRSGDDIWLSSHVWLASGFRR